jgi:cold shock CspA family protein
MPIGNISKLIPEKGIGFITPCGPGRDVFFHCSVTPVGQFEQLNEGQAVAYELDLETGTRERPRASKVELCDERRLGKRGANEPLPDRHPRARRRKPTWRR